MADVPATIATFTVDRLAYSPHPAGRGGGHRLRRRRPVPVRADRRRPEAVTIGDRVEMTFRRLYTADGVHNYFWKARPLPTARN